MPGIERWTMVAEAVVPRHGEAVAVKVMEGRIERFSRRRFLSLHGRHRALGRGVPVLACSGPLN
ncbi:MAG: hypothetical protein ACREXU_22380, partial [Gammaproteobacteria bacterium]